MRLILEIKEIILLFAGGLLAGVINVMAGGAGFMTFPLLLAAGMTEIEANASNFVAVVPANIVGTWVYRGELQSVRKYLGLRLVLAVVGGILGSIILIETGQAAFQKAIPWLLAFATLSFALGPWIKQKLERDFAFDGSRWMWLSFILEFLVFVYGGYFGLGMGIVMFAIYSIFSHMTIHQANAIRNITITLMTLVSIVIFARAGVIRWLPSLIMMSGAIVGGYFTVNIAKRVPPHVVRYCILVWAVCLTALAFWRYL
ncbi:sulfite exporter TauE/SafE family protein [Aestuariivirga sp.]|uniref:sulfite exporter TauE/SafE family protein n=1 Tax=Aestuariivirga sp. TaxID=2650926 RepID=UPI0039E7114F